jgi:hypothetical protein
MQVGSLDKRERRPSLAVAQRGYMGNDGRRRRYPTDATAVRLPMRPPYMIAFKWCRCCILSVKSSNHIQMVADKESHLSVKRCEFRWSTQHLLASLLAGVWKAVASAASTRSSCRLNQRPRKTLGFLFAHKRHPFNRRSSTRWCCIDLLNAPRLWSK